VGRNREQWSLFRSLKTSLKFSGFNPLALFFWSFVVAIIVATITNTFLKAESRFTINRDSVSYAASIISTFLAYTAGVILVAAGIGYSLHFKTFAKKCLVSACILSIGITLNFLA
jgi:hypothetical protein